MDEIIDLSLRYGIVTPYSSYLITEDDILTEAAAPVTTGEAAVAQSQTASGLADSEMPAPASVEEGGDDNAIRLVGSRTFVQQEGVWVETTFDPSTVSTTKVQFASDDYLELLDRYPDLAVAFARGDWVIAFSHGVAFEVTPEEQPPLDLDPLPA